MHRQVVRVPFVSCVHEEQIANASSCVKKSSTHCLHSCVKTCVLGSKGGKIIIFIKILEYNAKENLLMEFIINYRMVLLFKLYLSMKKAIITCISTSYHLDK